MSGVVALFPSSQRTPTFGTRCTPVSGLQTYCEHGLLSVGMTVPLAHCDVRLQGTPPQMVVSPTAEDGRLFPMWLVWFPQVATVTPWPSCPALLSPQHLTAPVSAT